MLRHHLIAERPFKAQGRVRQPFEEVKFGWGNDLGGTEFAGDQEWCLRVLLIAMLPQLCADARGCTRNFLPSILSNRGAFVAWPRPPRRRSWNRRSPTSREKPSAGRLVAACRRSKTGSSMIRMTGQARVNKIVLLVFRTAISLWDCTIDPLNIPPRHVDLDCMAGFGVS
jgi:hypothetical protein